MNFIGSHVVTANGRLICYFLIRVISLPLNVELEKLLYSCRNILMRLVLMPVETDGAQAVAQDEGPAVFGPVSVHRIVHYVGIDRVYPVLFKLLQ